MLPTGCGVAASGPGVADAGGEGGCPLGATSGPWLAEAFGGGGWLTEAEGEGGAWKRIAPARSKPGIRMPV
jgi:hypothetical protein